MENKEERRGHLTRALLGTSVLNRLDWSLTTDSFIVDMLVKLGDFSEITPGKPAICALLEVIREYVGFDDQANIDALIVEFLAPATTRTISTPPHLLFDLLLQMDFKQQVRLVEDVLEQHRTAAFLVHGEPDCGQELLVNRLFRIKPAWKNNSPIKNDVTNNAAYRSTERLWKQLARSFVEPIDTKPKPEDILEKICDRWQTKDVIFIFEKVDCMPPKILEDWLLEFWEPLVNKGKLDPPEKDTHLLMFLVDNCSNVCKSQIKLAKQFDEPEYPRLPLYLPPVSPFSTDVLKDWLSDMKVFRDLQIPSDLTYQRLWEKSDNGIPQFVYEEICTHFDLSWEGDLAQWLI
ncbi:XRE family transcriptional regulator [Calothrix sp. FACHB-1219]|nr:XRE family transcriptional regulator [Calothrix sp. FACHB-168]MBD2220209.1 XRE family transcriptional regulator [Calothrix sp. FACHB-1219]